MTIYFRLPCWATNVWYYESHMDELTMEICKFDTETTLMKRLKSGFLIRDMLEHLRMKINSTLSPDRSLWVYSAHDFTIYNLRYSLSLYRVITNFTIHLSDNFEKERLTLNQFSMKTFHTYFRTI